MNEPQYAYGATLDSHEERNELVMQQMSQVYYIARQIHERLPKSVSFDDLVNTGVIGLIDAVRSYNPAKNTQLNTFAKFRIRGAILDSLREMDWGTRYVRRKGRRVEEAISRLEAKLGRTPSEHEIAAELNMPLADLWELLSQLDMLDIMPQTTPAMDGTNIYDRIENAPSPAGNSPFEKLARNEAKGHLADAIGNLSEKEQMVVSLYYQEELTMREISAVLNVAESRVSQIHALALRKLRASLRQADVAALTEGSPA